jgi:hypothetical protein
MPRLTLTETPDDGGEATVIDLALTPEGAREFMAAAVALREGVPADVIAERFPNASAGYVPAEPDALTVTADGELTASYAGAIR